ncbi:MAG: PIG-L deacetylase family protein [Actinomycetota bacterium]
MEPTRIEELGTILAVFAHPDDETYLAAGIMADAVRAGSRVVCVTATRGELGSWDEVRWPVSKLGAIREAELMEGLRILGVREHHWLDYRDGGCGEVPVEEGTGKILPFVEEVNPDTLLAFGPDGMTNHPDHIATSAWATAAFHEAAKPGARLFYATITPEWAEVYVPRFNRFKVFPDGPPATTPVEELGIMFPLSPDLLELKLRAIGAHVSQVEHMLNAFGEDFFREGGAVEAYRLAETKA